MHVISAEAVASSLPWLPLIDRIGQAFREGVEAPPRHHHAIQRDDGEATMLLMPAWEPGRSSGDAITVFKSVGASLEDLAAAIEVWQRLK
ncbi:ornithine cyclodeaminase [Marinobacter sp. ELB17]|uniref:ornithine cyclodeaminase n=1 Tax=Marinobacter sp. ELB17 TaxID=270374 RepID=UPI0000F3B52F|nr:ornithine cyclodeaminase [Marinobacter sp. ELB17]EAZ98440.1 ornithine cyclodeaminase [Marinobacter sp. ELB17]